MVVPMVVPTLQRVESRTPAPLSLPLRIIETQGRVAIALSSNAGADRVAVRFPYLIGQGATALTLSLSNWYLDYYNIYNTGNAVNVVAACLETQGGATYPFYFDENRNATLANGETDLQTDPLAAATLSLEQFSRGEIYWVKLVYDLGALGNSMPHTGYSTSEYAGSQMVGFNSANTTISDIDISGTFTHTGTAPVGMAGLRPVLLGTPVSDGASFVAVGDSITEATSYDTASAGIYGKGFVAKAMSNWGVNPYPCLLIAKAGARVQLFNDDSRWETLASYGKYALDQLGTNNIAADSISTLQSRFTTLWTKLSSAGCSRIYRIELMCGCSSSDSFATTANQTVNTNWGSGGTVDNLHAWFATKVADNTLYQVLDNDDIKDASNPFKWRADGSANYATTDGTHPTALGFMIAAINLRKQLQVGFADDPENWPLLRNWWDPTTGVTDAGGGAVSSWVDRIGSVDANQSNGTKRPITGSRTIGGINAIDFDGTDDFLDLPNSFLSTTGIFMIHMIYPDTADTSQSTLTNNGTGGGSSRCGMGNQQVNFGNTSMSADTPVSSQAVIQAVWISAGTGSKTQYLYTNNTLKSGSLNRSTPATNFNMGSYNDGGAGLYNGLIGHFMIYDTDIPYNLKNITGQWVAGEYGHSWTDLAT